jgi:hypothetical protein
MRGEDMAHLRQDASDIADDIREAYLRGKADGIRESIKWAAGPHYTMPTWDEFRAGRMCSNIGCHFGDRHVINEKLYNAIREATAKVEE